MWLHLLQYLLFALREEQHLRSGDEVILILETVTHIVVIVISLSQATAGDIIHNTIIPSSHMNCQ